MQQLVTFLPASSMAMATTKTQCAYHEEPALLLVDAGKYPRNALENIEAITPLVHKGHYGPTMLGKIA